MKNEERNRERRLRCKVDGMRGMARVWGGELIYLVKNTSRDKQAKGYGGYMYITLPNDMNKVEVLAGGEPYLYSLSIADAEEYAREGILPNIELYQQLSIIDDEKERKRLINNWDIRYGNLVTPCGRKLLSMRLE